VLGAVAGDVLLRLHHVVEGGVVVRFGHEEPVTLADLG
jgi:hypothetical protein